MEQGELRPWVPQSTLETEAPLPLCRWDPPLSRKEKPLRAGARCLGLASLPLPWFPRGGGRGGGGAASGWLGAGEWGSDSDPSLARSYQLKGSPAASSSAISPAATRGAQPSTCPPHPCRTQLGGRRALTAPSHPQRPVHHAAGAAPGPPAEAGPALEERPRGLGCRGAELVHGAEWPGRAGRGALVQPRPQHGPAPLAASLGGAGPPGPRYGAELGALGGRLACEKIVG